MKNLFSRNWCSVFVSEDFTEGVTSLSFENPHTESVQDVSLTLSNHSYEGLLFVEDMYHELFASLDSIIDYDRQIL